MKKLLLAGMAALALSSCKSGMTTDAPMASSPVSAKIDLVNVSNDQVKVTINPGRISEGMVKFRLPRVVQGTYDVSDFGQFVEGMKAYNYTGQEIPIKQSADDVNTWTVSPASQLDYVTYLVNDTFDIESEGNSPFSPSGTNIDPDAYVLNLHGFVGYFEGYDNLQYDLEIMSPSNMVSASPLKATNTSESGNVRTTTYRANRYFEITDNPMFYGNLDVQRWMVGDIEIELAVYSPNGKVSAADLKTVMDKSMIAQKRYLGDINSTKFYGIYLYLSDMTDAAPRGFGALEHQTSTIVVLPETMDKASLNQTMIDVVSHEFFHIVSPLSIHSEDVHYFDYNQPTFSKHLWMYEGVTEYFATHFQVYEDLVDEKEFYSKIQEKIGSASGMNDSMSFTLMSENILDEPYASQYLNVYSKGALIGMCIDILMRENSNGQRSMLSLMKQLAQKYGTDRPFEDDKLIDEIESMTYPAVGSFLREHVEKGTPIDYEVFFNKVGLTSAAGRVETNILLNGSNFIMGPGSDGTHLAFTGLVSDNSFWADQGVEPGDMLISVNGTEITLANAQAELTKIAQLTPGSGNLKAVVSRNGVERTIDTPIVTSYTTGSELAVNPAANAAQTQLRKAWLGQ